jgi:predicted nucleic-acid-binding protein
VIALDTNVLVRFLVDDDAAQGARARRLLERAVADGSPVFVPLIVTCEVVRVLTSVYGFTRSQVDDVLDALLRSPQVVFEHSPEVRRAVEAHRAGRGDLADYLIRERALRCGCDVVSTFDKTLLEEPGFAAP